MSIIEMLNSTLSKIKDKCSIFQSQDHLIQYLEKYKEDSDLLQVKDLLNQINYENIKGN